MIVRKYWKIILSSLILIILLSLSIVLNMKADAAPNDELIEIEPIVIEPEEKTNSIYVDIKGAVKNPGVYQLEEGSRVIHAIEKSGGLKSGADTSVINLSKKLEDGNVIIIYTKNKINELKEQEKVIEYIEKECVCPDMDNTGCMEKDDIIMEQLNQEQNTTETSKVSLNNATKEQLLTIPGIGEAKAQEIIAYRQQKKFETIEEIKEVKGIGDSLFEKIKEYIIL